MRPVLNTIAFGGVPTGIMNAQDADRAVTISSCSAGTPIGTAAEARSGMSVAASAVFDAPRSELERLRLPEETVASIVARDQHHRHRLHRL